MRTHVMLLMTVALVATQGCQVRRPIAVGAIPADSRVQLAHPDGVPLRPVIGDAASDCRVRRMEAHVWRAVADTLWIDRLMIHGRADRRQDCIADSMRVVLGDRPDIAPRRMQTSVWRTVGALVVTTIFAGAAFIAVTVCGMEDCFD